MYIQTPTTLSTKDYWQKLAEISAAIAEADALLIGAGAGLSTAAGLTYSGKRFSDNFGDFIARHCLTDMYSAGFYPFKTLEERWAYWSRHIDLNRYQPIPGPVYGDLLELARNRNYFILTTNVDHCFQKTGFAKSRLFYTQGDYGLWQCSRPCHAKTYDNRELVKRMVEEQRDMKIPTGLVPYCPRCQSPMSMNLRIDNTFVEDAGWHEAARRYNEFLNANQNKKLVLLELGVGENTPAIIKYPFWEMTRANPQATYIPINLEGPYFPKAIEAQTIALGGDLANILEDLEHAAGRA